MIFRTCFLSLLTRLVFVVGFAATLRAADLPAPPQTPVPGWFVPNPELDLAAESRQSNYEPSSTGLDFLQFDEQFDLRARARTTHIAFRITSQAGLSEGAQLSPNYDPTYEQLELHFLRVWRTGAAQDRLAQTEIKVIQQERDLERQMFNGELSAVLVLSDVRVGDIIEYSYTHRGWNPVFEGHFLAATNTGWASPVRYQHTRLLVPAGRTVQVRQHGDTTPTKLTTFLPDGTVEHNWTLRNLTPLTGDSDAPSWHVQHGYLEFSEFADWAAVQRWAIPLYALPASTPALREKALALTAKASTPEEKILAVLDFVQRDIRYLGIELGANSHRPHPPALVLERRFGDCKDKVTLFRALLAELGLSAHPALVSTYRERKVDERLPGPYAFNHVIALVELGAERYWLDPTQSYQRGDLKARDAAYESKALVIRADAPPRCEPVPPRAEARARREVTESFTSPDLSSPARLTLTYRYFGAAANGARAYLANNSKEEITRDLLDRHKRNHPELATAMPLHTRDDPERNLVEFILECNVPELWKKDPKNPDRREASFYPWTLHNTIVQPDNVTRRSPLALDHPITQKATIEIVLPSVWDLSDFREEVKTDWYTYLAAGHYEGKKLTLTYEWNSRSDHVPVEGLRTHIAKLTEIREHTGYTLTHTDAKQPAATGFSLNWRTTAFTLCVVGAFIWYGWWLYHRPLEAPPLIEHRQFRGLGGWLVLPAISLVVRPFYVLAQLGQSADSYYGERVWSALMTPGTTAYQPALAALVAFEAVGNVALLMLSILTAVFFFRQKRQAPRLMIALLAYHPLLQILDWVACSFVELPDRSGQDGTLALFFQGLVVAAIWIPYFVQSRRVRATFTE